MPNAATTLLLYCRPGFEGDLAVELMDRAATLEVPGYCRAANATGYVVFEALQAAAADRLWRRLAWRQLVFARQLLRGLGELDALPTSDRAEPIAATVAAAVDTVSSVYLEYPDTDEGKALSRFCRRFERPLTAALRSHGVVVEDDDQAPRLHALFLNSSQVLLGLGDPANSAPWPLGIPRLRRSREAPSRSTVKLDEALQSFLDADARWQLLRPGMTAVDLGAAPGGWSWQLARRGLRITAVDNGPMDTALLAGGLVQHIRADGFRYRPPRPVDWLVCDIVEQPHRVARLIAEWFARGDCSAAIFNLKLPMKQRYTAVRNALAALRLRLRRRQPLEVACKQLYHDREEVTVYVRRKT